MRPSAVLFDLDGTILDSAPIICAAMSVASAEFGHPREPAVFARYVGPPPWHTFGEVTGEPPEQIDRIVARYREIYDTMMAATPVFPGVPEVIDALAARGVPLAVETSKLRSAAIALLEGVGLADRFLTCSPWLKPGDSCFVNGCLLASGARRSHSVSTGDDRKPSGQYVLGCV
jgi:phosphoglycolate phosphatase